MALHSLVAASIATQYRRLKKHISHPRVFCIVFLFMGIGYLTVSQAGGWAAMLAGLFISGLGLGFYFANVNAWLVAIAPPHIRGRAVGILATFVYLGQFVSPIAFQPIVGHYDPSGAFVAGGAIMLLLAIVFFLAGGTRRIPDDSHC